MNKEIGSINIRLDQAEERICELEDRSLEIIQLEEKKKKMKRNGKSLKDLWDTIKRPNIHVIGVPEGE